MKEQDLRNIAVVHLMYTGNEAERENIARDIVWHVPGHNPVSGEYRGYEAYTQLMPERMGPLSRWDFDLLDVMVNGDYVMTTFRLKGERKGKAVDLHGGHLFRISAEGKVVEGWGFTNDQDALDDFFTG
jgi:ketosteroid isomerase-like protein